MMEVRALRTFATRHGIVRRDSVVQVGVDHGRQLITAGFAAPSRPAPQPLRLAAAPPSRPKPGRKPLPAPVESIGTRWAGETAFVLASGPSLSQADAEACRGLGRVMVVNATYQLAPWADALYAADFRFWNEYFDDVRRVFTGELWSCSERARDCFGTQWIRANTGEGFCPRPMTINGGGNSGFQAVHLAATFGCSRIVLLGFDMQRTAGREHWHGPHRGGLPNGKGFAAWMDRFSYLARDLGNCGVRVVNCTRVTAMHCVDERRLEDVLDEIRRAT